MFDKYNNRVGFVEVDGYGRIKHIWVDGFDQNGYSYDMEEKIVPNGWGEFQIVERDRWKYF